jgi:hypothetical protein
LGDATFARIMPATEDIATSAVPYSPSVPVHAPAENPVVVHAFPQGEAGAEARRVVEIVGRRPARGQRGDTRPKRPAPLRNPSRLREAGLAYRAIEMRPLEHRPVVRDLLALTHALSHGADRIAWLALLRAPWCGLVLADLLAFSECETSVWEAILDDDRLHGLSADGRERVERLRSVLAPFIANRRRSSLRCAVEGAWLALGGPACVETSTDLEDADIFLDHLEESETAGDIDDLAAFEESLAELFALPDLEAPETLQVMTIHKAKGLEFDTVVVPGLGLGTGKDERKLFMWMEAPDTGLLLAPVNAAESPKKDEHSIYELIRRLDKRKGEHECVRLSTWPPRARATRSTSWARWASGTDGAVAKPAKGSLLEKLWPVLAGEFARGVAPEATARPADAFGPVVAAARQGTLRRLDLGRFRYEPPAAVAWRVPPDRRTREEIEFTWGGRDRAPRGQRGAPLAAAARGGGASRMGPLADRGGRPAIDAQLAAAGVADADLPEAGARVVAALGACIEDARGQWVLGPQREARCEHRVTAIVEGVPRALVIDRLFTDAKARRWIVDYKTGRHQGGEVEAFLDREVERYRPQLTGYAAAIGGQPVACALLSRW